MRFQYLSLLSIALLGFQQPVSGRRGGGGSSDSSDSSDSSSSGGSSSGGSSEPYCYEIPSITSDITSSTGGSGASWLYQWIGTYYNGTIDVRIGITTNSESCGDQEGVFSATWDGVLALAEMPAGVEGANHSSFIFLLSGWEEGSEPNGKIEYANSYLPSNVMAYMNSITSPRDYYYNGSVSWLLEATSQGNGYDFTGIIDDSSSAATDDSNWAFDIPPCNGSDPSRFDMQPFDAWDFTYDSADEYAEQRNQVNGTFDSSKASVMWKGEFTGRFQEQESTGGLKFGRYQMTFSGNADTAKSHKLVTTGSTPSWELDPDVLVSATPTGLSAAPAATTCVALSSGVSLRSGFFKTVVAINIIMVIMVLL